MWYTWMGNLTHVALVAAVVALGGTTVGAVTRLMEEKKVSNWKKSLGFCTVYPETQFVFGLSSSVCHTW